MQWNVFCRVVDNFGDIGVCWRLARALAARGEQVRLWVDDAAALAWMAPQTAPVDVRRWTDAQTPQPCPPAPGAVVVEAFGCDPPAPFVAGMAAAAVAPVWINLEYLSAEDYVERSHGLASPQFAGPGRGLTKWFFYPGFTPATGGMLRGTPPPADRDAWLRRRGMARAPGERVVVLFCYDNAPVDTLLDRLAGAPTLVLAAPGPAQRLAERARPPAGVRVVAPPWLAQPEFDQLLGCADLNFVRGEDSFVQAQWAGVPFVWQIYPQHDDAHAAKLEAFLARFNATTGWPADQAQRLAALWRAWNSGSGARPAAAPDPVASPEGSPAGNFSAPWPDQWPDPAPWTEACQSWRQYLASQPDLASQLHQFAIEKARIQSFASD